MVVVDVVEFTNCKVDDGICWFKGVECWILFGWMYTTGTTCAAAAGVAGVAESSSVTADTLCCSISEFEISSTWIVSSILFISVQCAMLKMKFYKKIITNFWIKRYQWKWLI